MDGGSGENLLDVVDKLTAESAAQEAALQAHKAAEAASLSRIAQLEEEQLHFEEQYSSVQVRQSCHLEPAATGNLMAFVAESGWQHTAIMQMRQLGPCFEHCLAVAMLLSHCDQWNTVVLVIAGMHPKEVDNTIKEDYCATCSICPSELLMRLRFVLNTQNIRRANQNLRIDCCDTNIAIAHCKVWYKSLCFRLSS